MEDLNIFERIEPIVKTKQNILILGATRFILNFLSKTNLSITLFLPPDFVPEELFQTLSNKIQNINIIREDDLRFREENEFDCGKQPRSLKEFYSSLR